MTQRTFGRAALLESVIGSYNLDLRSSYLDTELMLVIESRELNQELEGSMGSYRLSSTAFPDADLAGFKWF